jgi:hypothetical protein
MKPLRQLISGLQAVGPVRIGTLVKHKRLFEVRTCADKMQTANLCTIAFRAAKIQLTAKGSFAS